MIVLEFCPADYVQVTQAYDNKKKKPLAFLEFRTLIQVLIIWKKKIKTFSTFTNFGDSEIFLTANIKLK